MYPTLAVILGMKQDGEKSSFLDRQTLNASDLIVKILTKNSEKWTKSQEGAEQLERKKNVVSNFNREHAIMQ